jgi:filamentous hemagglutinin family protein
MTQSWSSWYWRFGQVSSLAISGAIAASFTCALAQVVPDATLPTNSGVTLESNEAVITEGTKAGSNLFHSFEQFSVPTGGTAYFNNALDIQNIFSRVTGSSVSDINGQIRANGTANLFLLNPNGIIFGRNASLNIGGSFLASTASSLNFADDTQFSAKVPQATPLLAISVPIGLQFGGTTGRISVQKADLQVQPGSTLALVGGNITLDGGTLTALGGRIELAGVSGVGTVGLNLDKNLALTPQGRQLSDVFLTAGTAVNVRGGGGGSIAVNALNLNLDGGSKLLAGIEPGLGAIGAQAGDIAINATGDVNLTNESKIANTVETRAIGNAGNINITTGALSVTKGATLTADTAGQGNAGNVNVHAGSIVSFDGVSSKEVFSGAFSRGQKTAIGNAGNINITARSLYVTNRADVRNGARLSTGNEGQGNGGNVNIITHDTVSFDRAVLFTNVNSIGVGNGGDINIRTGSLSLKNGARFVADAIGQGNSGSINIHARDTASFDGVSSQGVASGVSSRVRDTGVGKGSDINITAGSLSLANGALVNARTTGSGDGGNITINVKTLEALSGGQIVTSSRSAGKAGNITLNVNNSITLSGRDPTYERRLARIGEEGTASTGFYSGIYANAVEKSSGIGGAVKIVAGQLNVWDGAKVNVGSGGTGAAGNLIVKAGSIRLDNKGTLSAETAFGQGGNITLKARNISLRHGSHITATAGTSQAGGDGGNIIIDTDLLTTVENSDITANAFEGRGGNVQISTQGIFLALDSDITASSQTGVDGVVEINKPNVDSKLRLANLPVMPVDPKIVQACRPSDTQKRSEFVVTGRGGLPPNHREALASDQPLADLGTVIQGKGDGRVAFAEHGQRANRLRRSLSQRRHRAQAIASNLNTETAPTQLVEAQGWIIDVNGKVVLTTQSSTLARNNPWLTAANCHQPQTSS